MTAQAKARHTSPAVPYASHKGSVLFSDLIKISFAMLRSFQNIGPVSCASPQDQGAQTLD